MTDRAAIWREAATLARNGPAAALATVARRRGSLPMASDAKMLVTDSGRRWGTVGGGCVEADVIRQSIETIARGAPAVVRHTLNADVAGDLGLSCGGTVHLFLEPIARTPAAAELLDFVSDAVIARRDAVVVTGLDWSTGPRKLASAGSDRRLIGAWETDAPPAVRPGEPGAYVDDHLEAFIEPVRRVPRLILFGAGHVGCEIARAAAGTDFHVVVVDDRAEFANRERFPQAHDVIVADHRTALDRLELDADDFVIACTRGHAMDALIVERTAASAARYVGMLGSERKRVVIWKALARAGVPEEALQRVKVPIGDPIGADTPGEIGIAVMAELIRIRRSAGQPGE